MARKETWNEMKEWDYFYLNYPMCWVCGERTADDGGHGVINKGLVRNKKFKKYLDVKENFCPQCRTCNMTIADTWEVRNRMYNLKCEELGQERIDAWLESIPLKKDENFQRSPK